MGGSLAVMIALALVTSALAFMVFTGWATERTRWARSVLNEPDDAAARAQRLVANLRHDDCDPYIARLAERLAAQLEANELPAEQRLELELALRVLHVEAIARAVGFETDDGPLDEAVRIAESKGTVFGDLL